MSAYESPAQLPDPSVTISDLEFSVGYQNSFKRTIKFICSLGANIETAEEISQAAWTRGWRHRHQLQKPQFLSTWINTIARNLYREHYAHSRRFSELEEHCVDSNILQKLEAENLLAGCTEPDLDVMRLYYFEGYSSDEIAVSINKSPITVRVRLMRIRQGIRDRSMAVNSEVVAA